MFGREDAGTGTVRTAWMRNRPTVPAFPFDGWNKERLSRTGD